MTEKENKPMENMVMKDMQIVLVIKRNENLPFSNNMEGPGGYYAQRRKSVSSVSSVSQSCPTLCDPMNRSTPGLPVHHQLPKFTQIHIHRVGEAIQPSHPLSSPSPPAPNPSSIRVFSNESKVREFQL